ncbi:MAG: helix-turn-helix domain-containing protein, partial [Chitinispirillales bacterium]|nr:helix-turn-helix domain-containing protein [Chitinispirillales bacterium]
MTARPTNFRSSALPKSNARLRAEFEALKEQLAEKIRAQDVAIAEMSGSAASVHSNAVAVVTVNRKAAPAAFAANLIAALRAAGISQSDLAKRVGCSRSAVSDYVCGGKLPRKGMLERINEALGTNLSPTRPVNVKDFARDVGRGVETIR